MSGRPQPDEPEVGVGPSVGGAGDEDRLRDMVETEARADAGSGMYDINVGVHGNPLLMEHTIDRWNHQWSARTEQRKQRDEQTLTRLTRNVTRRRATEQKTVEHLEQELEEARAYRDRLERIVDGTEAADDGGYWPARSRVGENRRREAVKDWVLYIGAGLAEVGLNYAAFQLMGNSLQETAVLAASVILVTVLLPKQLGELIIRTQHARRGRGLLFAGVLVGGILWVGAALFIAMVRTAYLLLPSALALQTGQGTLLERAGLGSAVLTVGWLLVVLGVGSAVLIRSALRYNPYVKSLPKAVARVEALRAEVAAKHGEVAAVSFDAEQARGAEAGLAERWTGKLAEQDGLAGELKSHYRRHLARELADPTLTDQLEIGAGGQALPPPVSRWGAAE